MRLTADMLRATAAAAGLLALLAAPGAQAAIDWSGIPGTEVVLFYPGQSSWEWALTPSAMSGAEDFRKGKPCSACHVGEEETMGAQIVTGKPRKFMSGEQPAIEPTVIPGKPGSITATVKFANDGTNLYVHLDFDEGAQPDSHQDPAADTRVTVMFDDGKVPEANRGGCFAACHNDSTGMPDAHGAKRTMYLPKSRATLTEQGGGDNLVPPDQLAKLQADGYQLEYWQALLNPGQPAKAATELVLAKREAAASNIVEAQATQTGSNWSVTISRPLKAPAPFASLAPGGDYHIAFAIHAGHTADRFHYVSFERTLKLTGNSAELVESNP